MDLYMSFFHNLHWSWPGTDFFKNFSFSPCPQQPFVDVALSVLEGYSQMEYQQHGVIEGAYFDSS